VSEEPRLVITMMMLLVIMMMLVLDRKADAPMRGEVGAWLLPPEQGFPTAFGPRSAVALELPGANRNEVM
jgi:hypothetical protein